MLLDRNNLIYMKVCQLHWRNGADALNIVKIIGANNIIGYKHQNYDSVEFFVNPIDAVIKIISCESRAHIQANYDENQY